MTLALLLVAMAQAPLGSPVSPANPSAGPGDAQAAEGVEVVDAEVGFGGEDPSAAVDPREAQVQALEARIAELEARERQADADLSAGAEAALDLRADVAELRDLARRQEQAASLTEQRASEVALRQQTLGQAVEEANDGLYRAELSLQIRDTEIADELTDVTAALRTARSTGVDVGRAAEAVEAVMDALDRDDGLALTYRFQELKRSVSLLAGAAVR